MIFAQSVKSRLLHLRSLSYPKNKTDKYGLAGGSFWNHHQHLLFFSPPPPKRKPLSAFLIVAILLAGLFAGGLIGFAINIQTLIKNSQPSEPNRAQARFR
jgi:hypothetical protein